MRRAARITSRVTSGEWRALYVTRDDGLTGISPETLATLKHKAEQLGGTFHTVVGNDPAEAILDFARAENATQVIIGASRRGRISTVLRPGVGERVVAGSGDIDIHIVTHDYARRRAAAPQDRQLGAGRRLVGYLFGDSRLRRWSACCCGGPTTSTGCPASRWLHAASSWPRR